MWGISMGWDGGVKGLLRFGEVVREQTVRSNIFLSASCTDVLEYNIVYDICGQLLDFVLE
ncbi:MAG: hypothetical protein JWS10_1985 [Cypionkella sp.]|nr:hypothetical protein [Cypionkella sp.]